MEEAYTAGNSQEGEEDTGIFCRSCSPLVRKIGYWLSFLGGVILFVIGVINIITGSPYFSIVGSVVMLLSPLWVKSPCNLFKELKNPARLVSLLIFVGFLIVNILAVINDWFLFVKIIIGVLLALSAVWYFLSYFEKGQEACLGCIKSCCKKGDGSSGESS